MAAKSYNKLQSVVRARGRNMGPDKTRGQYFTWRMACTSEQFRYYFFENGQLRNSDLIFETDLGRSSTVRWRHSDKLDCWGWKECQNGESRVALWRTATSAMQIKGWHSNLETGPWQVVSDQTRNATSWYRVWKNNGIFIKTWLVAQLFIAKFGRN